MSLSLTLWQDIVYKFNGWSEIIVGEVIVKSPYSCLRRSRGAQIIVQGVGKMLDVCMLYCCCVHL